MCSVRKLRLIEALQALSQKGGGDHVSIAAFDAEPMPLIGCLSEDPSNIHGTFLPEHVLLGATDHASVLRCCATVKQSYSLFET